jgi:transcriptional regulator with XRE-family HTH domain
LDEKNIIHNMKQLRTNKKITLKTLAKRTGFTEGYLSRIENSKNVPPFSTLNRIAQGLKIDLSYFFLPENVNNEKRNIVINRHDDIEKAILKVGSKQGRSHSYDFLPLAEEKFGKNMQPYILIADFETGDYLQHDGEEFFCVLDGNIEFFYGSEKHLLTKGDYVYYDSHIPHNARSIGKKRARALHIFYPYRRQQSPNPLFSEA